MTAESATLKAEAAPRVPIEAGSVQAQRAQALTLTKGAFVVGYSAQTEWAWLIATAFFLGKIGGGLFAVSMFFDSYLGMLLGILIAVGGKGIAHLLYLGRWERFWRILANPGSSWISRGFWAIAAFAVFGLIYIAPAYGVPIVQAGPPAWEVVRAIALLSVFVVMFYDGFVMNASTSIPLWNTSVLPVLCLSYSLLGGTSLSLALLAVSGSPTLTVGTLETMEISLIVANMVIVAMYLSSMFTATSAAKQAATMLIAGRYAAYFIGLAIVLGLIVTLILALLFMSTHVIPILVIAAIADLIGHFSIFFLLLRAGLFAPVV